MLVRRIRLKRYKILRSFPREVVADAIYSTAVKCRLSNINYLLSSDERSKIYTRYFLPNILPVIFEKVASPSELKEVKDFCTSIFDIYIIPETKDLVPYALGTGKITIGEMDAQAC